MRTENTYDRLQKAEEEKYRLLVQHQPGYPWAESKKDECCSIL